jgi:hypothetical protein
LSFAQQKAGKVKSKNVFHEIGKMSVGKMKVGNMQET